MNSNSPRFVGTHRVISMIRRPAFCRLALLTLTAATVLLSLSHRAIAVGATTPFVTLEAEAGTLGGGASTISWNGGNPGTTDTPMLEASGRAYVQLTATGQSVTLTNNTGANITYMNLRVSIPSGGISATLDLYVNGSLRQAIPLSSAQTWNGTVPGGGNFYQEYGFFVTGAAIAPGSAFMFKKDSSNTASFYYIDCVDAENPPAPLTQPANSLSITSYGAVANNSSIDNTTAIQNCITAAQSAGKSVWIPQGTFYFSNPNGWNVSCAVSGAGLWYSTLYHQLSQSGGAVFTCLSGGSVSNLAIDSNAPARGTNDGYGINGKSTTNGWTVNSVRISHTLAGIWADGSNGLVENSRFLSTYGDGINLNNNANNCTAENNFVRSAGDDSMAINSQGTVQVRNLTFTNNTAVSGQVHEMAVYGGINDVVTNNLLADSEVQYPDLNVSLFGPQGFQVVGAVISGNTMLRGGGTGTGLGNGAVYMNNSPSNVWFGENTISDSMFEGICLDGGLTDIVCEANTVDNPRLEGIHVTAKATGNAVLYNNLVENLPSGQVTYVQDTGSAAKVMNPAIQASQFSSQSGTVSVENSSEGGQDINNLTNGAYTVYPSLGSSGVNHFTARVASGASGGNIAIHLDSPTGTLIGTCAVPGTGGWQNWVDAGCSISGASGTHSVYLVYTGGSGNLFSLEWFALPGAINGVGAKYETEFLAWAGGTSGVTYRVFVDGNLSGGEGTTLDATAVGNYAIIQVPTVAAGSYDVRVGVKKHSTRGIMQLAISQAGHTGPQNLGLPVDEYSATDVYTEIDFGTWTPGSSTDKWFWFTVTGQNAASSGYTLAWDYIKLIPN